HLCWGIIPAMRTPYPAALALLVAAASACGGSEPAKPAPAAAPAAVPAAPRRVPAVRVFVTNETSGTLSVIDADTHELIGTAPLGKRPRGIQVSPDRKSLYVALSGSPPAPPGVDEKTLPPPDRSADGIGVVDAAALKLVRMIPVGTDPEQLALSKDGTRLFVSNEDAATASVVALPSGQGAATGRGGG